MKKLLIFCLAGVLAYSTACGSGGGNSDASADYGAGIQSKNDAGAGIFYDSAPMPEAYEAEDAMVAPNMAYNDDYVSKAVAGEIQPEKIIKTGNVSLSTEQFDRDKLRLEALTREMGGFIESSSIYNDGNNWRFEAVLRVPSERFAEMKKAVEETGKLLSSSEQSENVTSQYYDMEGRLTIKRTEEERIIEMIEEAENVETLLALEEYLGNVRTDIELLESQIKDIDSLSSYSTLHVYLIEGVNIRLMADAGNFGQRLWQNFRSSASGTASFFESILVFLAGAVIPLGLIALLVYTVIVVKRRISYKLQVTSNK